MEFFPSQDFLPGLLIILVVNTNDVFHIFMVDVIFVPAPSVESLSHEAIKLMILFMIFLDIYRAPLLRLRYSPSELTPSSTWHSRTSALRDKPTSAQIHHEGW